MQEDMKYDKGKPIAGCLLTDFPRALLAIAELSTIGAKKYKRSSWLTVPNGRQRYTDKVCGQEAINFTTKLEYDHYVETGICERCHSAE